MCYDAPLHTIAPWVHPMSATDLHVSRVAHQITLLLAAQVQSTLELVACL
jgi:hypothetical protein